jgi:hypothetical protein
LRVIALVCRQWAAGVAAVMIKLIHRDIAANLVRMVNRYLCEPTGDPSVPPGEYTLYTSPLMSITTKHGCFWPTGVHPCIWYVDICKFDPVAQIFIRTVITPFNAVSLHRYINRTQPLQYTEVVYLHVATQQYQMKAVIVTVDGLDVAHYRRIKIGLATPLDDDRYERIPAYCMDHLGIHRYVLAHIGRLIDFMVEPTVDIGRHLPGLTNVWRSDQ